MVAGAEGVNVGDVFEKQLILASDDAFPAALTVPLPSKLHACGTLLLAS